MAPGDLTAWLLDSDPTLRWQVERDLLDAPDPVWQATRARILTEGDGARLLARQDPDGQWAGGAYFPAEPADTAELPTEQQGPGQQDPGQQEPGQPWTATTWSLTTLRDWGMDAAPLRENGTADLLARHARWEYEDRPFWDGEVDCCINAMTLSTGVWLGRDVDHLAEWFVEHQLADGGWNCEWVEGSTRASFHSTLNSLKGLLDHEIATGGTAATRRARLLGEEYLLGRELLRRESTGEIVGPFTAWVAYPFRWVAGALHQVEYFRRSAAWEAERSGGGPALPPDPRMTEAIALVRERRDEDGTWHQGEVLPGAVWFALDVPEGEPSRWLTLHALRVLRWADGGGPLPR